MALLSLSLCLVSVILSLVTSPVTGSCKLSDVKLENNGYTGIVVAIREDVPETPELIDAIKKMFINGSKYLYTATKKRTYFKEVTILLPLKWPDNPSYTDPGKATYEGADIIVAEYNPTYSPGGSESAIPYTERFAGCGEQSLYIHLTPSFLLKEDRMSPIVGDYGRMLVHHWGHYRWGLFSEYPDRIKYPETAKEFYYSERNQMWKPVSCTSDWLFTPLKYTGVSPTHTRCSGDPTTGFEKGCALSAIDNQPSHITGSIMHSHLKFDQVVNFCDNNPNDRGTIHNSEAPTEQNEKCEGKSCWEVMREHPDFNGYTNNQPRDVLDVTPTFFVVRSKITRIVLVMDTSGSMRNSDRYLKLANAVRTYFLTIAAPGTFIGIVDFDSDATIVSSLQEMTSDSDRRNLADLVPEDANGETCIGCGMKEALKILRADGGPGGSKILLMTDGLDGNPDLTALMREEYISNNVIIDAVAISNVAEPKLVDLTEVTGGRFYLQTDEPTSTGLLDAINANSRGASYFETSKPLQSSGVAFNVGDTSHKTDTVVIDKTLGRLTTFDFSYFHQNPSGGAAVHITVKSPSEEIFDRSSEYYYDDLVFKKVTIRIPDIAEPGPWECNIYNQDTSVAHDVIVSVTSFPSQEEVDPITVTPFLCGAVIRGLGNKRMAAYVSVRQRFNPVVDARVIATVERPTGGPVELQLYDNGAGADLTKDDGIYSRYFTQFDGAGYYGFSLRVVNDGQATVVTPRRSSLFAGSGNFIDPELLLSEKLTEYLGDLSIELPGAPIPEIVGVPAPNFTRRVSGGAGSVFEIPPEWDPSIDTFAPNKITDLAVLNTSFSLGTVAITFTAPGDNFDFGNAHHYVIRWATSSQELRDKSSTTNEIYQTDVLHGNLFSPAPYGDEEIMIIQVATVPQHLETYSVVLGLYAVDESGNEGDMSNTAIVTFRKVIPTPEPVQTTTREPTQSCQYWFHPFLGVFASGDCEK